MRRCRPPSAYCQMKVRAPPALSRRPKPGTSSSKKIASHAAIDLCVVPTLTFDCLFAFLVLGHGRRQLLWFAVTRHPTAEWLAQQLVEAFRCATMTAHTGRPSRVDFGRWGYATARSRRGRPGRIHMLSA